jgi:hypothetical protein
MGAADVLQAAGTQGPVVVIAALFGLLKVLKLHADKVERLTNSLSHSISTMTEAQGRREERMTDALRESTTAIARVERAFGALPMLRNGAG